MSGGPLIGITHVQVPVSRLEYSTNWYCRTLGCELTMRNERFAVVGFVTGPAVFLWQTDDRTVSTFMVNGEPFPTVGIETREMEVLKDRLLRANAAIHSEEEDGEGRRFLKFYDPDGNLFVIHQEPDSHKK